MILFPNAKNKYRAAGASPQADGYYDIESIFVPLPWCDILEIVPSQGGKGSFNIVGNDILRLDNDADNLVVKALKALESYCGQALPPLDISSAKKIPTGAWRRVLPMPLALEGVKTNCYSLT